MKCRDYWSVAGVVFIVIFSIAFVTGYVLSDYTLGRVFSLLSLFSLLFFALFSGRFVDDPSSCGDD